MQPVAVTAPNSAIPAGKRRAEDMNESAWNALETGLAEFFAEERREDKHAEDEPTLTKEGAGYVFPAPGPKQCQNCSMFQLADVASRVGEALNVKAEQISVAHQGRCSLVQGEIEPKAVCQKHEWAEGATDSALAYDYLPFGIAFDFAEDQPVGGREEDQDGRLRVTRVHISKANICPYKGSEIPGWKELGLERDRIYKLYRDPDELARGAETSNGVQLLKKHTPVSADDAKQYDVVGSVGTEARFSSPYLDNSITVWTKPDIEAIQSGKKKQLSMGYHYVPDMTPGRTPDGEAFDGVMRNIRVNHVAIVEEGRAGPDVVVADSLADLQWDAIAEALHAA